MPTKTKLEYLPAATRDLREIGLFFITAVGSKSTRKIYQTMRAEIARLQEFPLLGPVHPDPELAAQGYRMLVLTKTYVAIYRVIDGTVYIYRIVNGRTDYPKLLK